MNRVSKLPFLLAFLLFPALVFAQFDTAEVLGTARDTTHGVLVGVIVTLINQDTSIQAKTTTDENGNYNFFNVKVGRYTITAELAGFTKFSTTDVVVNVNARQRVDVTLQVGAPSETIEVKGVASAPGVVNAFLGNWQVSSIISANTGEPLNVFFTPNAVTDVTGRIPDYRGLSVARPNLIGDPTGSSGPAMLDNYFNKAAFQIPTPQQAWGNLGRNAFRAPNLAQWDLAIHKEFPLPFREGMNIQFRSEFFNALNHTNFRWPDCNFSNASFGTIRSTYPPRQIQFGLKVLF